MSSTASNTFAIKPHHKTHRSGTQHPVKTSNCHRSPARHGKRQLRQLRLQSPPSSDNESNTSSTNHPSSPSSSPPCPPLRKPPLQLQLQTPNNNDPNPPILPKSAYNYQPFSPASPPPLSTWPRAKLFSQLTSPAPLVYLTCNLTNPVHLASILAHGCGWDVVEQVAGEMTAARGLESEDGDGEGKEEGEEGVLLGGLVEEAMERLEGVFERRGCVRRIVRVRVVVADGGEVVVSAYAYRRLKT